MVIKRYTGVMQSAKWIKISNTRCATPDHDPQRQDSHDECESGSFFCHITKASCCTLLCPRLLRNNAANKEHASPTKNTNYYQNQHYWMQVDTRISALQYPITEGGCSKYSSSSSRRACFIFELELLYSLKK